MTKSDNDVKKTDVQPKEVDLGQLLARRIAELSLEKKCENVKILDLKRLTSVTDYFVIITADSDRKARAAADHIVAMLKEDDERPLHIEGLDTPHWILLDYVNVVVHIFMPDERRFYDLESLWSDAPVTMVS
ncbi:ribosome silencing factor [Chlorobium phaeobacteroides]|jgi:ribosome-associated protein|uniref:Ribosomal silencing factor RsfS n=1 Tax=Chlorobium phaeobacteroides (strain DSM 266 / SMG 266 / 2430) TaxID=290317 RepID=A1BJS1_CHLPD|nr:ribosome silencing factor [Chlorobium phaeobacteroides]ABL66648.1 iojap-like protein [Chlorobium phaeobacteroides DSM 266]MBV5319960.1 ribosome silencing factor [Chlorobium phaeobacteroides]